MSESPVIRQKRVLSSQSRTHSAQVFTSGSQNLRRADPSTRRGEKHSESFDQNAVQFRNYRIKPQERLSVYRPNCQGKIQVGHA